MILNFIPLDLIQALAAAGIMFLINNMLGMYNAMQWFKFDREKAVQGIQQTVLLMGAVIGICGVTILLPGELLGEIDMLRLLTAAVEALVLARVGKAIAQFSNILNAKKQQAEQDTAALYKDSNI